MTKLNTTNQMVRAFGKVLAMRPETIARRAAKRAVEMTERKASMKDRLQALAERDGPESIWAELLAERS